MKQEDKELLLKDLCTRLPYGVKVLYDNEVFSIEYVSPMYEEVKLDTPDNWTVSISDIKPYLFPLSSMTDEQRKEFLSVAGYERRVEDCGRHTETYYYDMVGHEHKFYHNSDAIDWLNKNHFDYRGLIEKGLAIDATKLNIY